MTGKQLDQYFQTLIQQKGERALYSIQVFLTHDKAALRQKAVKALASFPFEKIKDYVVPCLDDSTASVKKEAITTLVVTRDEEAKEVLENYRLRVDPKLTDYLETSLKKFGVEASGVLSVWDFTQYINTLVGQEPVQIEGEVSAFQTSTFGANQWVFFDLKDEEKNAKIRCFTNIYTLRKSRISPVDGMRVIVTGKPRLSAKSGVFSVNVDLIELSGEGELLKAFELLKAKLYQEGLFDADRKRAVPEMPQTIGLITSQDAAAYKDFMKVLTHRMGGLDIYFAHAQVQGVRAVETIIEAIERLNSYPEVEVIVLTRGGGAMDDLHAFNDEQVARAIYASKKPVISAVGHERDETIADFVADMRASTPSNAAELLTPHRRDLMDQVSGNVNRMQWALQSEISRRDQAVDQAVVRMERGVREMQYRVERAIQRFGQALVLALGTIERNKMQLDRITYMMNQSVTQSLERYAVKVDHLERYIKSFDHTQTLKRGYSITRFRGKIVSTTDDVAFGDSLQTELADGTVTSAITKIHPHED